MASIVVAGDTSGTVTLAAPSVAGTTTLTLPTTSGTVALTSQIPTLKVVQIQFSVTTTTVSTTSSSYTDTGITCNITPTSASNRIIALASYNIYLGNNSTGRDEAQGNTRMLRGGTEIANTRLQTGVTSSGTSKRIEWGLAYTVYDQPATTSSLTYKIQMATAGFETIVAQQANTQGYLILMEVTA